MNRGLRPPEERFFARYENALRFHNALLRFDAHAAASYLLNKFSIIILDGSAAVTYQFG